MVASGPRPGNREYIHSWASLRSLAHISHAMFGGRQVLVVRGPNVPSLALSTHLACVTWPHYFTMHTFKRNLFDWYVSTNPDYPVSYYICHFWTDKIVCQEIFVQMLILTFLLSSPVKMKILWNERIFLPWMFYQQHMLGGGRNCFQPRPFSSSLSVLSMAFQAWKLQPMNQPRDTVYWQRILSNYPYSGGMCQMLDLNQTTSDPSSHTKRLQADGLEQVSWVYLKVVLIHGTVSVEALHAITLFRHRTSIFQTLCLIERKKDPCYVSVSVKIILL